MRLHDCAMHTETIVREQLRVAQTHLGSKTCHTVTCKASNTSIRFNENGTLLDEVMSKMGMFFLLQILLQTSALFQGTRAFFNFRHPTSHTRVCGVGPLIEGVVEKSIQSGPRILAPKGNVLCSNVIK